MGVATKLDYADYAAIAADGQRHEIIDGEHYANPAPNLYHQTVSKRLQYQLYTKIELAGLGQLVLKGRQYRSQTVRDELRAEFIEGVVIDLQQVW